MNTRTEVQILKGPDGQPAYAVLPYADYLNMRKRAERSRAEPVIPNAVVGKVVKHGMTPIRAWREHLGLTQGEMAERLNITQPAYAQQETSDKLRKSSREKIAAALGIAPVQLDF